MNPSPEPLEARIAPATLLANVVEYTDHDGDVITIKTSKGTFDLAENFVFVNAGLGEQLQTIKLGAEFSKTNLLIEIKTVTGDGLARVGYVNAAGIDIGNVTIPGDLGRIDAGDANLKTAPLKTLSVDSLGFLGTATQEAGGDLISDINGSMKALLVTGHGVTGASVEIKGNVSLVRISGDITGTNAVLGGAVHALGNIGIVEVTGAFLGGGQRFAGSILAEGKLGKATIVGDLTGGGGDFSGGLYSFGNMGAVSITGNVAGGGGSESGQIDSNAALKSVHITGNLLGGAGIDSGGIDSNGNTSSIIIDGSITGGTADEAGLVEIDGNLGKFIVGGNVTGGSVGRSGLLVGGKLGSASIAGNLIGGAGSISGSLEIVGGAGKIIIGGGVTGGGISAGSIFTGGKTALIQIGGVLQGGGSFNSGQIFVNGDLGKITVAAVVGGTGQSSGYIGSEGTLGLASITGNVTGGGGPESGVVFAGKAIKHVEIGGNLASGAGPLSGAIDSNGTIGLLHVSSSIIGTATVPVNISAAGKSAIMKIDVGGNITFANILAGYNDATPVNADAGIGTILVGGNLIATNIVAGVVDTNANGFGNADDVIFANTTKAISSIGKIEVGGVIDGTAGGADHFGITAQAIKKILINAVPVVLTTGAGNDDLAVPASTTGDITIREVL